MHTLGNIQPIKKDTNIDIIQLLKIIQTSILIFEHMHQLTLRQLHSLLLFHLFLVDYFIH